MTDVVQKAQRSLREFRIAASPPTFRSWLRSSPSDFARQPCQHRFHRYAHAAALVAAAKETTAETLLADAGSAAENGAPKAEVSSTGPAVGCHPGRRCRAPSLRSEVRKGT